MPSPYAVTLRGYLAQERPLFRQNNLVFLGEIEIRHAFAVGAKPRPIGFIGRETFEGNQRRRDVVGALMRHPVADQIAAASGNDGQPAFGVFLEQRALERIELVADENGNGHEGLLWVKNQPSLRANGSRERAPDDR